MFCLLSRMNASSFHFVCLLLFPLFPMFSRSSFSLKLSISFINFSNIPLRNSAFLCGNDAFFVSLYGAIRLNAFCVETFSNGRCATWQLYERFENCSFLAISHLLLVLRGQLCNRVKEKI